jgi:predicted DNA-binding mobile mystery protein A
VREEFRELRLNQLNRQLKPFRAARAISRPQKGWVRAIREALGISSTALGIRLGSSRQLALQQEKAEAEERITLKNLRTLANALDCDLVYALVPRTKTIQELIENRSRVQAQRNILGVEHSMALEDQAAGNLDQAIEIETQRLLKKRGAR